MNAFWVYIAKAGEYLLTYETMYGTFYIMFEQSAPGSIAIYLHPRDVAYNITIAKGMIDKSKVSMIWEGANTMVYGELPYLYTFPDDLFMPQAVTPILINLLPVPWVGLCPAPGLDCYPWR